MMIAVVYVVVFTCSWHCRWLKVWLLRSDRTGSDCGCAAIGGLGPSTLLYTGWRWWWSWWWRWCCFRLGMTITIILIHSHPETGLPVLCFHLGMTEGFLIDQGTKEQRSLSPSEVQQVVHWNRSDLIQHILELIFYINIKLLQQVLDSIKEEICREGQAYSHVYQPGDFIISDNLAVGHEADPATQLPREEVKLAFVLYFPVLKFIAFEPGWPSGDAPCNNRRLTTPKKTLS